MVRIEKNGSNEKIIIELDHFGDGEIVTQIQKSLILGLQEIGNSDHAGSEKFKVATYFLGELLKGVLLSDSQANVGLGGQPYREVKK